MVIIGGKKYSDSKAKKIMSEIDVKLNACYRKLLKTELRRNLIEGFLQKSKDSDKTLIEWLKSIGVDFNEIFESVGYYTPLNQSVSNDDENDFLKFFKGMVYNSHIDGYVPDVNNIDENYHRKMAHSSLGMTFNPNVQLYFPKTIYDTELFSSAIGNGDEIIDIVGFFRKQDISTFTALNKDTRDVVNFLKELYEEEFDNVEEELDTLLKIEDEYYSNFSNADSRPARNVACRSRCAIQHPFNKSKRESCQDECDKRFPPSERQEDRRENREIRRESRRDFRAARRDCREQFRSGVYTRQEMRECRREERAERRRIVREAGGNFFTRVGRSFARVNPITLTARGSSLAAISQFNLFGFATRMYPAFATGNELNKYKPESVRATKKAWERISRAWRNLGGDPEKLKQAIINGRNRRITKEPMSNAVSASVIITASATVIGGLIQLLNTILRRNNVSQDPFKRGEAPYEFTEFLREGGGNFTPEPNDPIIDPETGNWIDPETGRVIDPLTGRYLDELFGMNKYLFYGLSATVLIGSIFLIRYLVKK